MQPHRMTKEEGEGLIGKDDMPPPRRLPPLLPRKRRRTWGSGLLLADSTRVSSKEQHPRLLIIGCQAPLHPPLRLAAPTEKILGRAGEGGNERQTLNVGELL
jgi:hypothetical protein